VVGHQNQVDRQVDVCQTLHQVTNLGIHTGNGARQLFGVGAKSVSHRIHRREVHGHQAGPLLRRQPQPLKHLLIIDNEKEVLAYSRFDDEHEVIAIFNTSSESREITMYTKYEHDYEDILSGFNLSQTNKTITLNLPSRSAAILVGK